MSLPKFIVSITGIRNDTRKIHVLESYNAENAQIAAYLVAANEIEIPFGYNEDRGTYDWEDVEIEFEDYGYSVIVKEYEKV